MLNQVMMVGKMGDAFYVSNADEWVMELEVDGIYFLVKVWEGVGKVLKDKESGTLIAIKGHLTREYIVAERVSVISNDDNLNQ